MIKAAICDDDLKFTGYIEELLSHQTALAGLEIETEIFFDGATLEDAVRNGKRYDLIYLDIEMKDTNGIEAARFIRELDKAVLLIYISGYEQYLIKLFEVEPFRFLLKPLNEELFIQYFQKACARIRENNAFFQYTYNKEIIKVTLREIVYFESRNRLVYIYLSNGNKERFYGKLNDVEKELHNQNQRFLRIHQSYLVNYDYVRKINFSSLVLDSGFGRECSLQISEDRQKNIRLQLCEITGKMT